MKRITRLVWAIGVGLALVEAGHAQVETPWTLYEGLQGSFNSSGQIYKLDTSLSYALTDYLEIRGGAPVYLVRASEAADPLGEGWNAGLGNAYLEFRLRTASTNWALSSGVTAAAPTGDRSRGFSTGEVSLDWANSLSIYLPRATLFGSAGLANTVSDTAFFVRPFTSDGLVADFDLGLFVPVNDWFGVGGLSYVVQGGGEQRIVSRLIRTDRTSDVDPRRRFEDRVETRGQDLADDHGFSGWVDFLAGETSVQVGYSRSVPYGYDTAFFSVGFDVIPMFR